MATGREDGAYYAFATEYQKLIARQGFRLRIVPGAGSVETLERLKAGEAMAGFVQAGTASASDAESLVSLASLFHEPLWVFHRKDVRVNDLSDLRGRQLAVGEEGSGARMLALQLLRDNDVTAANSTLLPLGPAEAEAALAAGRVDAALFVMAPSAPLVPKLLRRTDIELMSERRARAYGARHPYATGVVLGEGTVDVRANLPREEKTLLAVTANLVAREDIHPDLVRLLLGAASRVHRRGGPLEAEGAFPSDRFVELPLHEQAQRYLKSGPPWLERVLPFWAAGLLDRTALVMLPMLTLLLPFFGLILPMMDRRHRGRIARFYAELRACDQQCDGLTLSDLDQQIARMRELEREVTHLTLPNLHMGEMYNLKIHIGMVLRRLEDRRMALAAGPASTSTGT
jgi:TRAP transporter TAXI family solute receptor